MPRSSVLFMILIVMLAAGGVARAQTDLFRICTDTEGTTLCGSNVELAAYTPLPLYVLISDPTGPQVAAWEGVIDIETAGQYFGEWALADDGINLGTGEEYIVGHGANPLQPNAAGNIMLLSMEMAVLDDSIPVEFHIRGIPGSPSFDEGLGYASAIGVSHVGYTCSGDYDTPVLTINGPEPQPDAEFAVELTATAGDLIDTGNFAGALAGATDGLDYDYDALEPPHAPSNYVSLYFFHDDWSPFLGDRYMTDYRASYDPAAETKVWPVQVATDQVGPVVLTCEVSEGFDPGWAVYLHDPVNGWTVDFALLESGFTYQAESNAPRPFELWIGPFGSVGPTPSVYEVQQGWSMLGLPLIPPEPGTIEEAFIRQAWGMIPPTVYDFEPGAGYRVLSPDDPAEQDRGYWAAVFADHLWELPAGIMNVEDVVVPLSEGWTMVGYPLWAPSSLDVARVTRFGGDTRTWNEAVDVGWISAYPMGWDTGYFQNPDTWVMGTYYSAGAFETWNGYWVAGHVSGLELSFNFADILASDIGKGGDLAGPDDWRLELAVNEGGFPTAIGVSMHARDGFDARYDLPAPPPSPDGASAAGLRFPHAEWDLATGPDVVTDIRSAGTAALAWDAVLSAPEPGPVTLSWSPTALPAGVELELVSAATGQVLVDDMSRVDRVTLDVGESPLTLVLRTPNGATGADEMPAALDHAVSGSPNPFNPSTEIALRTAAAGEVGLEIYDMRGRNVRRFALGELPAGAHAVTWRGRDDEGREVAGGTYFACLVLDGVRTGAMAKLTLVK